MRLCVAFAPRLKALPEKNELANSCFFTYRLAFKMCPEQPPDAPCNKLFGLNGADFQKRAWEYYTGQGPPLLEEAAWMMTMNSGDKEREEILRECPAILILSYLTIAEAQAFLVAPNVGKTLAMQARMMIEETRRRADEVL